MRTRSWQSCFLAATLSLTSSLASATVYTYAADLGPEAQGATGSGIVKLKFDDATNDLSIYAGFAGLSGVTTVAHIHCCTSTAGSGTIGVAVTPGTLPGFPVGVSAESYSALIDLDLASSFTSGFINNFGGGTVAGARTALFAGLDSGTAYFNIHTNAFPGGEIRAFPERVPEPASLLLGAIGIGALVLTQRGRRRL